MVKTQSFFDYPSFIVFISMICNGWIGVIKIKVSIDFLRSNCRVTNQPDFGDMLIYMKGDQLPELQSLAKYVVSHRQVNHFHEEIAEMTYVHLMEKFNPKELMVTCLYSRRGGIEINPTRASDPKLIPSWLYLKDTRFKKTLKQ